MRLRWIYHRNCSGVRHPTNQRDSRSGWDTGSLVAFGLSTGIGVSSSQRTGIEHDTDPMESYQHSPPVQWAITTLDDYSLHSTSTRSIMFPHAPLNYGFKVGVPL